VLLGGLLYKAQVSSLPDMLCKLSFLHVVPTLYNFVITVVVSLSMLCGFVSLFAPVLRGLHGVME
jgi:hypothetical protein